MIIKKIYLENFRSYEKEEIEFHPEKNVLYGFNGQGKTNVIEALYYFCTCKSFRSTYPPVIITPSEIPLSILILKSFEEKSAVP